MSGFVVPSPSEFETFSPRERRAFVQEMLAEIRSVREELADIRACVEAGQ